MQRTRKVECDSNRQFDLHNCPFYHLTRRQYGRSISLFCCAKCKIGCVNWPAVTRGSPETVFTQPLTEKYTLKSTIEMGI